MSVDFSEREFDDRVEEPEWEVEYGEAGAETDCDWVYYFGVVLHGEEYRGGEGVKEERTDRSEYGGDVSGDSDDNETVETGGECTIGKRTASSCILLLL